VTWRSGDNRKHEGGEVDENVGEVNPMTDPMYLLREVCNAMNQREGRQGKPTRTEV